MDYKTGYIIALGEFVPSTRTVHSEATIGFLFRPRHTRADYLIEPTKLNVFGTTKWKINTTRHIGAGSIRVRGLVYTSVWEINPVNSQSELTHYGAAIVLDQLWDGQGEERTTTVQHQWSPGPTGLTVQLQGDRDYAVHVTAAVHMDNYWTNDQGGPVQFGPEDDKTAWAFVNCVVPLVWITPSVVYES